MSMNKEDFKLDAPVAAVLCDGTPVDGILKGINEDRAGKIQVDVEYQQPVQQAVDLDKVTLK